MLLAMVKRVFLGWDQPFLRAAVAWLLGQRDELATALLVVPTAQSGARLREALAEAAGAVLSPRVVTPGSLLKSRDAEVAADWVEQLAWVEVLENVSDWESYDALFPKSPVADGDWASSLAKEMLQLRRFLQENAHSIGSAARRLNETLEAERWEALSRLEEQVERKLSEWGKLSRTKLLSKRLDLPTSYEQIILVGVTEMMPSVERRLLDYNHQLIALIGAPEEEKEHFTPLGFPELSWLECRPPQPHSLQVLADPRQQAAQALQQVSEAKTNSNHLALGSADAEVGNELARLFSENGWPAFHPAAEVMAGSLLGWFRTWMKWLMHPNLANASSLLGFAETEALIGNKRAEKAEQLAKLRDRWMVLHLEDLQRKTRVDHEVIEAIAILENWRQRLLGKNFAEELVELLDKLGTSEQVLAMKNWLVEAQEMMARVKREPMFWLELMLLEMPKPKPVPPVDRVLDVQGWLELFYEPGNHLVICGMNEGKVPGRSGGEPWLNEAIRGHLGLIKNDRRVARDTFLYHAILAARQRDGRVDVLCGKTGATGDPLLPSRLLLNVEPGELPQRVLHLFREIEPTDAALYWQKDFSWKPRPLDPPERLNVTSLRDYLACPYRYYLRHVLGMNAPEANRMEWNARDIGVVMHQVLENWGGNDNVRGLIDAKQLEEWLKVELERIVADWFGEKLPLAVQIQKESMRQQLAWFAEQQVEIARQGWEVIAVEQKFELPIGDHKVVGKMDRLDRHRETGQLRVIDYKTGEVKQVDGEHRTKKNPKSVIPEHWEAPAIYAKGKHEFLWKNLQLPLYVQALLEQGDVMPIPCYFTIGKTKEHVALREWKDFEMDDLEAAKACAEWIVEKISARTFWPPAEKVKYDSYELLAAGKSLRELL